ncbi:hypothetical protein D3C72_2001310 [compost metagenome]
MVSASNPAPSDMAIRRFTASNSSALKVSFKAFSSILKIFDNFKFGINFAISLASCKGKSNTLAVSLIDDLAAIVP